MLLKKMPTFSSETLISYRRAKIEKIYSMSHYKSSIDIESVSLVLRYTYFFPDTQRIQFNRQKPVLLTSVVMMKNGFGEQNIFSVHIILIFVHVRGGTTDFETVCVVVVRWQVATVYLWWRFMWKISEAEST